MSERATATRVVVPGTDSLQSDSSRLLPFIGSAKRSTANATVSMDDFGGRMSRRIFCAFFLLVTPSTDPPGCVSEEHCQVTTLRGSCARQVHLSMNVRGSANQRCKDVSF